MNTKEKIIQLLKKQNQVTPGEMAEYLDISRQALYKHLLEMLKNKQILKIGRPPKVFYALKEKETKIEKVEIDTEIKKIIDQNYFIITPGGERIEGFSGFIYWCNKQGLPIVKTVQEYIKTLKKY